MNYRLYIAIIIGGIIIGCQSSSKEDKSGQKKAESEKTNTVQDSLAYFGKKISPEGALTVSEMLGRMGDRKELSAKIKGRVNAVCQKKGCWLTIPKNDSVDIRVRFKDYGFFVPKNIAGEMAILKGKAYMDTISVKTLRHFAKDAGKPQDQIKQIKEPRIKLAFEAEGVIIK